MAPGARLNPGFLRFLRARAASGPSATPRAKMSVVEANCTLLVTGPDRAVASAAELQVELESPDPQRKVAALKKAIAMLLTGEDAPRMLMTVIRYCITVEDHTLQVRSGPVARASAPQVGVGVGPTAHWCEAW